MNSTLAYAYGSALGRLHAASMAYRPKASSRSRAGVTRWIGETLAAHGAPKLIHMKLREVAQLLEDKPRNARNYGMVHYDFEPDNVFWDGTDCHAIDFGDAMLHFYAIDLVQALDEMAERNQRRLPPPPVKVKGSGGKERYPVSRKTGEMLRRRWMRWRRSIMRRSLAATGTPARNLKRRRRISR